MRDGRVNVVVANVRMKFLQITRLPGSEMKHKIKIVIVNTVCFIFHYSGFLRLYRAVFPRKKIVILFLALLIVKIVIIVEVLRMIKNVLIVIV